MIEDSFDENEFWDDLLAHVESGHVIPIVGAEVLTIDVDGAPTPLYRVVADRLLQRYGRGSTNYELRPNHELSDAVALLAGDGRRVRDLYRPIHDIIEPLVATQTEPLRPLQQLACISHFRLFATTTPDGLLAQALNAVRFGGASLTSEIEYAPKLPSERRTDFPELPTSGYTGVFYFFGKADVSPFYAIHDEDALEFPYTLQQGNGPQRVFGQLRSSNLLFVGCTFGEWLSRFFIRMSTSERLLSEQRSTREFLVGREAARNGSLTLFLERFSRDSRCLPTDAADFVDQLYTRWRARNPARAAVIDEGGRPVVESPPAAMSGAIFISYAREDAAAARQLCEALQEVGGDVAWLDKSQLKPGDEWERVVRGAVQRCALFLAVVSRNTEQRNEGYFRLEWAEAAERARRIQGRPFLFPIVVDPEYEGGPEQYQLVPERFHEMQFSHAPDGRLQEPLRSVLTEQLRAIRRTRAP